MVMENETVFVSKKQKRENAFACGLFTWVDSLVWAIVFIAVLLTFFVRPFGVKGSSMEPTLQSNDKIVLSSFFYKPQRGDIVVSSQPNALKENIIKRVIAVEGDTVDINFSLGVVYVNGVALAEPYVNAPTNVQENFIGPITIPRGKLFVMGDNRNDSTDSRSNIIGLIDENYIVGKLLVRIYPFGNWWVK